MADMAESKHMYVHAQYWNIPNKRCLEKILKKQIYENNTFYCISYHVEKYCLCADVYYRLNKLLSSGKVNTLIREN